MPWIPARSADKLVAGQYLKMEVGKVIRVESFKGDRWVEIKRVDGDSFEVTEKGFRDHKFTVKAGDLKVALKRVFEVESPRSHQMRLSYTG